MFTRVCLHLEHCTGITLCQHHFQTIVEEDKQKNVTHYPPPPPEDPWDNSAIPDAEKTIQRHFTDPQGKIESIECLNLVPRLRIGDCLEIHLPHCGLFDPLLSITKLFCSKYCFAIVSSARSPCHLWNRCKFPVPDGHFTLLLGLKMCLSSPAVAM